MASQSGWTVDKNLYFLTSWNELNEQAVLEPDPVNGFAYLEGVQLSQHPSL